MSKSWNGVAIVAAIVALLLAGATFGFNVGEDWGRGALECEKGVIFTVRVNDVDEAGNGTYSLDIGDCERIEEAAFIAAVEALVGVAAGSTTTTTTTTTTTVPPSTTVAPPASDD